LGIAAAPLAVTRNQRADGRGAHTHAGTADAAAHRALEAVELADGRPRTRADVAFRHRTPRGGRRGRVAHVARRLCAAVTHREVEEEGARHVRDDVRSGAIADAALFEPSHDTPHALAAE